MAAAAVSLTLACCARASWVFRPSNYTHDPISGARVNQFAPKQPALVRSDPSYFQSGYRHSRVMSRGIDGSADRLHVVETWGAGESIRPYGEWQFPYRAGATLYGPWGNSRGPWTMPFDSWVNPYGLGRLPNPPWYYGPYGRPYYSPPAYSGRPWQGNAPRGPSGQMSTGPPAGYAPQSPPAQTPSNPYGSPRHRRP